MNINILKKIPLIGIFLLNCSVYSQIHPATVTTYIKPPYSVYLNDYLTPGQDKLSTTIVFNDYNETSWDVYLTIKIEGQGIRMTTRDDYRPPTPLTIYPGVPVTLKAVDLYPYFNYDNLNISGISRSELEKNGRLPEGFYQFCFEVHDYASGKLLSHTSCTGANLRLFNPPVIVLPTKGKVIRPASVQNILFQWQMIHHNPANTNYILSLYELRDTSADISTAIKNNQALKIFESQPIQFTSYHYGTGDPLLDKGKTYIAEVKAIDVDGKNMYKNGGVSESIWFYYGFPKGGNIEIIKPSDKYGFSLRDDRFFKWSVPDNIKPSQPYYYKMRILPCDENQKPEEAIKNRPWFEFTSETSLVPSGESVIVDKNFKTKQKYAWQVKAFSEDEEIAKSEVYTFTGPPFIERFKAGNHTVYVNKTTTTSLDDLCGEGKIKISKEGQMHKVYFNHIKLKKSGAEFNLKKGKIVAEYELEDIKLSPENNMNDQAVFNVDSIILNRERLWLKGRVEFSFNHPVKSNKKAVIYSQRQLVNYDNYLLLGKLPIKKDTRFDLLDPGNFTIKFDDKSFFLIRRNNNYFADFYGDILLPGQIKGVDVPQVSLPFYEHQLMYITEQGYRSKNPLHLVEKTSLALSPVDYIFDISEDKSPTKFSHKKRWKGLYFSKFKMLYPVEIDDKKQLILVNKIEQAIELDRTEHKSWVTAKGLLLDFSVDYKKEEAKGTFNMFPADLSSFKLFINSSQVREGYLKGSIKIPLLSQTNDFSFTVPLTQKGFTDGYLDEKLNGKTFVFNEEGGEQKMFLTINRAVFSDKERLDMNIDIEWPYLDIRMKSLTGFKVWGDYSIGFGVPNGTYPLVKQMTTRVKDFEIMIDFIGCGRSENMYSIGTSAKIVMAEDVAGPGGPPVVNLYSIVENGLLDKDYLKNYSSTDYENVLQAETTGSTLGNSSAGVGYTSNDINDLENIQAKVDSLYDSYSDKLSIPDNKGISLVHSTTKNPKDTALFEKDYTHASGYVNVGKVDIDIKPKDVINLLTLLEPYLTDKQKAKLPDIKQTVRKMEPQMVTNLYHEIYNIEGAITQWMDEKIEQVVEGLEQKITEKTDKINSEVVGSINSKRDSVIKFVNKQIDYLVDSLAASVVDIVTSDDSKNKEKISVTVDHVATQTKISTKREVSASIYKSVRDNITEPVGSFIEETFTQRVTGTVRESLKETGHQLIENRGDVDLSPFYGRVEDMFAGIATDVVSAVNINTIKTTIWNTADDAFSEIKWGRVAEDMLASVVESSVQSRTERFAEDFVEDAVDSTFSNVFGEKTGDVAGQLAQNVEMDFSNLGNKIQDGEVDEIISFDPSYIVVETNVADFEGYVNFTEDDPVWGDSWQASLTAKIKIKPNFTVNATYINGTKKGPEEYKYWFLELGVRGLGVPLSPIPLSLDGAQGKVYHHMSRKEDDKYYPDNNTTYGAGLQLYFYDSQSSGDVIFFDVGLELSLLQEGFIMEMTGNANVANTIENGEVTESVLFAEGYLGYNSAEKHFLGIFSAELKTDPLLCAGGETVIDISKDEWMVALGTREEPLYIDLLCTGTPIFNGWFIVNNAGLDIGLNSQADVRAASPWLDFGIAKFQPWAEFGYEISIETIIFWKPKFGIKKAAVGVNMYAGIGVDYESSLLGDGSLTIVAVSLGGEVVFMTIPETRIYGLLYGEVTVLNIDVGFELEMDKTF